MVRCSNSLLAFLNVITLLVSFPIIGLGILLRLHASSVCEKWVELPILVFGLVLLVVSILGIIGPCTQASFFLWMYLLLLSLFIVTVICYTAFAFVVMNRGAGEMVAGVGYKEYRLGDYSQWLQRKVNEPRTWRSIESCLKEAVVCTEIRGDAKVMFFQRHLLPIQLGCCKPPPDCGFTYVNGTHWTIPKSGLQSNDSDCKTWNSDKASLCYDCSSCKAGVLEIVRSGWQKVSIFNLCLIVFLSIVHAIGCCAFRNNRAARRYKRYYGTYR